MKFSLFYHSLVSDWNHGNAHFLRGVVSELLSRGHQVDVYEPAQGWSREHLLSEHGDAALRQFYKVYPSLSSITYTRTLDLAAIADDSDVVIVHEWNEPWLVNGFSALRLRNRDFRLLFHDTHHRAVSDPSWLRRFSLTHYDGILAFGEVLSEVYRQQGWNKTVWTWHEAADTRLFYPRSVNPAFPLDDVVWIGNWGDDERTRELNTYLFKPVKNLQLSCHVYGVRYPEDVLAQLQQQGINYRGWIPNFNVPEVFAGHRLTVHIPRQFYAEQLPGIPTIRPFEAMACGIPLICAPWQDTENLFTPGKDYLVAYSGIEMEEHIRNVLNDADFSRYLSDHALTTIRERHTCGHRVEQLLQICRSIGAGTLPVAAEQLHFHQPQQELRKMEKLNA